MHLNMTCLTLELVVSDYISFYAFFVYVFYVTRRCYNMIYLMTGLFYLEFVVYMTNVDKKVIF